MIRGLGRLRKTDTFAVVGVFLLLVWTPAYWAQSDDAEALSGGERFHLPERRVGDVIEYSLIIQMEHGASQRIGPVQRIVVETAVQGEVPAPAAYVETRTTFPHAASVGALRFASLPFEDRHYFDKEGALVWRTLRALTEPSDEHESRWVEAGVRTSKAALTDRIPSQVVYEADSWGAAAVDLAHSFSAEFIAFNRETPMVADRAATFGGVTHYGVIVENMLADRVAEAFAEGSTWDSVVYKGQIQMAPRVPHSDLRFAKDVDAQGVEKWLWVREGAARLAGSHAVAREVDGPLYEVDLIATAFVPGSGSPVPIAKHDGLSIFDTRPRPDQPLRPGHQLVPLSAIEEDTAPVHENASLADVRAALVENAPGALRSVLDAGARIVGFQLSPGDELVSVGETPLLPVGPMEAGGKTVVHTSRWFVALVSPTGELAIADVALQERPGPSFTATVEDLCAGPEDDRHHGCEWTPDEPIDWDRPTVAPGSIAAGARADHDGAGYLASYRPLERCARQTQTTPLGGWSCGFMLFGTLGDRSNMEWSSADIETRGIASWTDSNMQKVWRQEPNTRAASYDLGSGQPLEQVVYGEADPEFVAPATASSTDQTVTLLDVVGTKTAWSGAILVVATGLFRLVAALRAGVHVPLVLALFSRVSRADALLNERRADIVELLRADPGLTAQDVARRLDYSRTATMHHLETLMRTGQLLYVQNGQQRHYFPPDGTERERVRVALTRDEQYANLLQLVDESPGITLTELTAQLQRSKSRLSRTVARLDRLGVVRRERDGRTLRLFPVADGGS